MLQSQDLRVGQEKKPYIGFIQENSIENSVQGCLPYILRPMVHATLLLAYPKQPCVCLKVNMCLTYSMILFFQNFLYLFSMTHDHVTDG